MQSAFSTTENKKEEAAGLHSSPCVGLNKSVVEQDDSKVQCKGAMRSI